MVRANACRRLVIITKDTAWRRPWPLKNIYRGLFPGAWLTFICRNLRQCTWPFWCGLISLPSLHSSEWLMSGKRRLQNEYWPLWPGVPMWNSVIRLWNVHHSIRKGVGRTLWHWRITQGDAGSRTPSIHNRCWRSHKGMMIFGRGVWLGEKWLKGQAQCAKEGRTPSSKKIRYSKGGSSASLCSINAVPWPLVWETYVWQSESCPPLNERSVGFCW